MKQNTVIQRVLIALSLLSSFIGSSAIAATSAAEYRALGLSYRQQERFSEAIDALQKAVQLAPDHLPGRVSLGWTLHLAGQDRAAATLLQETLYRDPFHVPALNALGIIYLVNDDPVAAATTHIWAAWLAPDNEIAYYNLSLALQRLEQQTWAIDTAQQAVALEPDNPHPLVALAIAQWSNGEETTAQQTYQRAIALDSRYGDSAFLNFLDQAGFSPEQITAAKRVLQAL